MKPIRSLQVWQVAIALLAVVLVGATGFCSLDCDDHDAGHDLCGSMLAVPVVVAIGTIMVLLGSSLAVAGAPLISAPPSTLDPPPRAPSFAR